MGGAELSDFFAWGPTFVYTIQLSDNLYRFPVYSDTCTRRARVLTRAGHNTGVVAFTIYGLCFRASLVYIMNAV